jgi:hypothetical protein
MSVDRESVQRFFAGERTESVRFVINDSVDFEAEDGSRRDGAVVSIHSLVPEVSYIVEPGRTGALADS